jgi:hypothetical protein
MTPNRRKFLQLLGISTAAAPLAAKAAAEGEIAKQVGLANISGMQAGTYMLNAGAQGAPAQLGSNHYTKALVGAADYIKVFGLPEIISEELRDRANYIHALDPDIACKKSWSMNVKIMTQRQRNYDRSVQHIQLRSWQHKKREALRALLGFEWPG